MDPGIGLVAVTVAAGIGKPARTVVMPRAVRFAEYGDVNVLHVVEVDRPEPGPGEVLVEVVATSINPAEAKIRGGLLHDRWPATFPSGQGSDLAGRVAAVGPGVSGFNPG